MRFWVHLSRRLCGYPLNRKEIDRVERLKRRAHHLQNRLDKMPMNYNMDYDKAELSAICWAVEKITGKAFSTTEMPKP